MLDDKRGKRDVAPDSSHYVMRWVYYSEYNSCPQKYLWNWGHEEIDLGNGLGNPKTPTDLLSSHDSAMGIAIAYAIEKFYNESLWKASTMEEMKIKLKKIAVDKLKEECENNYINWAACPSLSEMEVICTEGVYSFLTTLKGNKLLSSNTKSEIILRHLVDDEFYIKGTLDILIEKDDNYTILDGKNTKYREKYLKKEQLLYYALLVYLNSSKLVERIGWLYYRFPYIEGNPEEKGVKWVDYTLLDLEILMGKVKSTWEGIKNKRFDPTPSSFECRFCPFQTGCTSRHVPKKRNPKEHELEVVKTDIKNGKKIVSFDD
jgi:hypothetical protein